MPQSRPWVSRAVAIAAVWLLALAPTAIAAGGADPGHKHKPVKKHASSKRSEREHEQSLKAFARKHRKLKHRLPIALVREKVQEQGEGAREILRGPAQVQVDQRAYPRHYVDDRIAAAGRQAFLANAGTAALATPWSELGPFTPAVAKRGHLHRRARAELRTVTAMAVDPNCGRAGCCAGCGRGRRGRHLPHRRRARRPRRVDARRPGTHQRLLRIAHRRSDRRLGQHPLRRIGRGQRLRATPRPASASSSPPTAARAGRWSPARPRWRRTAASGRSRSTPMTERSTSAPARRGTGCPRPPAGGVRLRTPRSSASTSRPTAGSPSRWPSRARAPATRRKAPTCCAAASTRSSSIPPPPPVATTRGRSTSASSATASGARRPRWRAATPASSRSSPRSSRPIRSEIARSSTWRRWPTARRAPTSATARRARARLTRRPRSSGAPTTSISPRRISSPAAPTARRGRSSRAPIPVLPGFASYNFCEGQCWLRRVRGGRSQRSRHRLPRRVHAVRRPAGLRRRPAHERPRGHPLDRRGRDLQRHDQRRDGGRRRRHLAARRRGDRHAPRPARHRVRPAQPALLLRGLRRWRRARQRPVHQPHRATARRASSPATRSPLCRQVLRAVPVRSDSLNDGLRTLQYQSVSLNPADPGGDLLGGTQDNGTWAFNPAGRPAASRVRVDRRRRRRPASASTRSRCTRTSARRWTPTSAARRRHRSPTWDYISEPLDEAAAGDPDNPESFAFYVPLDRTTRRRRGRCSPAASSCGARPTTAGRASSSTRTAARPRSASATARGCAATGADRRRLSAGPPRRRAGDYVVAVERAPPTTRPCGPATRQGHLWISRNANAADPAAVQFTEVDAAGLPGRFLSSITIDPARRITRGSPTRATRPTRPSTPGHVFDVRVNPDTGAATAVDLSFDLGDQPVTDLVRDDQTGALYASTDFGVLRCAQRHRVDQAADGMPIVAVYGLTIDPGRACSTRPPTAAACGASTCPAEPRPRRSRRHPARAWPRSPARRRPGRAPAPAPRRRPRARAEHGSRASASGVSGSASTG